MSCYILTDLPEEDQYITPSGHNAENTALWGKGFSHFATSTIDVVVESTLAKPGQA